MFWIVAATSWYLTRCESTRFLITNSLVKVLVKFSVWGVVDSNSHMLAWSLVEFVSKSTNERKGWNLSSWVRRRAHKWTYLAQVVNLRKISDLASRDCKKSYCPRWPFHILWNFWKQTKAPLKVEMAKSNVYDHFGGICLMIKSRAKLCYYKKELNEIIFPFRTLSYVSILLGT